LEHLVKINYGDKKIQDEMVDFLLAGRDTIANLLTFFSFVSWLVDRMSSADSEPKWEAGQ
jgi:hypothetical protein